MRAGRAWPDRRAKGSALAGVGLALLLAVQPVAAPPAGAKEQLSYSVKEARAYAFKVSLRKEVIEAVPKCNPEEDPYQCQGYNHKPNCPKSIAIGARGKAPIPKAPKEVEPTTGGAGIGEGQEPPPQSSPVRLNRYVSYAKQSHIFGLREAGGFASVMFTDLSGRSEPEAHTESEGFSNNKANYEERCFWNTSESEDTYEHFMSRSGKGPDTYHLSECVGPECNFGAGGYGANAERALSIVQMKETADKVSGSMYSMVEGLNFGDGAFKVDSVVSHATFSTDGTPKGLKWSVVSTASGAKLGGQPVSLPPGDRITAPGFSVGMAAPFVDAPGDGSKLTIVAPGLHFGSEEQAAFFGGAELVMSMGLVEPPLHATDEPIETDNGGGSGGTTSSGGGLDFSDSSTSSGLDLGTSGTIGPTPQTEGQQPIALEDPSQVLIFEKATGIGAVALIVILGGFCWFLLMSRWLQRYAWGRKLTRVQPFRFIDWMYRAFVKT